jgi:hypothetical protein
MQRRMHGPIHGPLRSNKTGFSMIGHGRKSRQVVEKIGGASRDRTDDLIVANDALSQLSYSPVQVGPVTPLFYQPSGIRTKPPLTDNLTANPANHLDETLRPASN